MKLLAGTAFILGVMVGVSCGQSPPEISPAATFLRLAAQEASNARLAPMLLAQIVEAQGKAKDVAGLKTSVTIAAALSPRDKTMQFDSDTHLDFAAAFAFAGDMDSYRLELAQTAKPPFLRELAYAYANAGDYDLMSKTIDTLEPVQKLLAYTNIAGTLAIHDPAAAKAALAKAEALAPTVKNWYADREVVFAYRRMGDVQATLRRAEAMKGDEFPYIYDLLEESYIATGEWGSARIIRDRRLEVLSKDPKYAARVEQLIFKKRYLAGDFAGARGMLPAMVAKADALRKDEDSNTKSAEYAFVAQMAARVGDDAIALSCLNASVKASELNEPILLDALRAQTIDDMRQYSAMWLVCQGKRNDAFAEIAKINKDNERQGIAFNYLINDALQRGDVQTATAALPKISEPLRRIRMARSVAVLVADPDFNDPKAAAGIDPMQWVLSLPTPDDRASAALAIATAMQQRALAK